MLINATLVSFDPTTWTAAVRIDGSAATTLTIPVAANIAPADLIAGRRALLWPGETGEPGDYLLLAIAGPQAGSSPLPPFEGHVLARAGNATIASNTTGEQTLFSHTVPGGLLRTDRALRFTCSFRYLNNTAAARTFVFRVKLGSTTLYDDTSASFSQSAQHRFVNVELILGNCGAANDQELFGSLDLANFASITSTTAGLGDLVNGGTSLPINGSAAENTALDRVFAVTIQLSTASTSHTVVRRHATLELL